MRKPKSTTLQALFRCFQNAVILENENRILQNEPPLSIIVHDPSRRRFIKNTLTAAVGMGLGASFLSACESSVTSTSKNNKIAIIGAGIAGLNCAYVLQKSGVKATIYEGSKRIGGRIYTRENIFGNKVTTEFGGEFTDSNHADMHQLIQDFGLETYDTYDDYKDGQIHREAFYINGRFYSEEEIITEFRKVVEQIINDKNGLGEDFDTALCKQLDNTSLDFYFRSLPCASWLQDLLNKVFTAELGLETTEQSALNFITFVGTDTSNGFKPYGDSDERYKVKGGNSKIIEALHEKLKTQIETAHQLTRISNKGEGYNLEFANGKSIEADYVIIAIPFTVLREVKLDLKDISTEKRACINELGYGQNNKLILGFKGHPWRENENSYAGYLFNDVIQNGWDSSHMQNNNQGSGSYTIYLGGPPSNMLAASAKEIKSIDKVADETVKPYLSKLDEIFSGSELAYTGTHCAALWSSNPFVKASYACYKKGQWTTISGLEAEPIGNVFFAGEHCSENFQGFMNGGAETGRLAAENVLLAVQQVASTIKK